MNKIILLFFILLSSCVYSPEEVSYYFPEQWQGYYQKISSDNTHKLPKEFKVSENYMIVISEKYADNTPNRYDTSLIDEIIEDQTDKFRFGLADAYNDNLHLFGNENIGQYTFEFATRGKINVTTSGSTAIYRVSQIPF